MVVNLATEVMEKILSLGKVCRLFVEVQCCLFMLQGFFFFAIALKFSSLSRIISYKYCEEPIRTAFSAGDQVV